MGDVLRDLSVAKAMTEEANDKPVGSFNLTKSIPLDEGFTSGHRRSVNHIDVRAKLIHFKAKAW